MVNQTRSALKLWFPRSRGFQRIVLIVTNPLTLQFCACAAQPSQKEKAGFFFSQEDQICADSVCITVSFGVSSHEPPPPFPSLVSSLLIVAQQNARNFV